MGSPSRLCSPCTLPAVPPVSSCPEAPPCTPVLLTACRRRSPPWLPLPSRSRSSLPQRGSTPSDRRLHPGFPLHLPADVDLQAGVRRVRPLHRPPQVLLSTTLQVLHC